MISFCGTTRQNLFMLGKSRLNVLFLVLFDLLVAIPTSFEGPFGKITYRVRAAIDTPRFSKDYKAQRPFYVLNMLNLNEVPDIEVRV